MKKVFCALVLMMTVFSLNVLANDSDVVKLVNKSDYKLYVTQKVSINGELTDGGWDQEPKDTYDEQYMTENTRLVFLEIKVDNPGQDKETIFSKTISDHSQQMKFNITVNPDKKVDYSGQ